MEDQTTPEKDPAAERVERIGAAFAARREAAREKDAEDKKPPKDRNPLINVTFFEKRREAIRALFDQDDDGRIGKRELAGVDSNNNRKFSDEEIDALLDGLSDETKRDARNALRLTADMPMKNLEGFIGIKTEEPPKGEPKGASRKQIITATEAREEAALRRNNPTRDKTLNIQNDVAFHEARRNLLMAVFDKNGDKRISTTEFDDRLDPDKDGTVSQDELDKFNKSLPEGARRAVSDVLRLKEGSSVDDVKQWLAIDVTEASPAEPVAPDQGTPAAPAPKAQKPKSK